MKRGILGLILLLGAGCVQFPESTPGPVSPPEPLVPLGKDLTADQVTPVNANAVAQMMWDQFDREAQETADAGKKK